MKIIQISHEQEKYKTKKKIIITDFNPESDHIRFSKLPISERRKQFSKA